MLIGVYGTLKKGGYLYEKYTKKGKFIGIDSVKGQLYSSKYIPFLSVGSNDVEIEIYDVSDEIFDNIDRVETECGYYSTLVRTNKNRSITVWKMELQYICKLPKIDKYDVRICGV